MAFHSADAPIQDIWNDRDRFAEFVPDDPDAEFCVWCLQTTAGNECLAQAPDTGYECTRERGHAGKHVACGGAGSHKLAIWD